MANTRGKKSISQTNYGYVSAFPSVYGVGYSKRISLINDWFPLILGYRNNCGVEELDLYDDEFFKDIPMFDKEKKIFYYPEIINIVDFSRYKSEYEKISDKKEKRDYKGKLPCVTYASECEGGRRSEHIKAPSGFICFDFDSHNFLDRPPLVEYAKNEMINIPFVCAVFKSISGMGLHVWVYIGNKDHHQCWEAISEFFYETLNIIADSARMHQVATITATYDPDGFVRNYEFVSVWENSDDVNHNWIHGIETAEGKIIGGLTEYVKDNNIFKERNKINSSIKTFENSQNKKLDDTAFFVEVCNKLIVQNEDGRVIDDYYSVLNIGFSIIDGLGINEDSENLFLGICSFYFTRQKRKGSAVYKDICKSVQRRLESSTAKKTTFATLYFYAKKAGIDITNETRALIAQRTDILKNKGANKEAIVEHLEKFDNINKERSTSLVEKFFGATSNELASINQPDNIEDSKSYSLTDFEYFIKEKQFKFLYRDSINGRLMGIKSEGSEAKVITEQVKNRLWINYKGSNPDSTLSPIDAMRYLNSDMFEERHPIFDYLKNLADNKYDSSCDGTLDELLGYIDFVDPGAGRVFVATWLLSFYPQIFGKFNCQKILVLLSPKTSIGKSEFFVNLLPKFLVERFYGDMALCRDKRVATIGKTVLLVDDEGKFLAESTRETIINLLMPKYVTVRNMHSDDLTTLPRLAMLGASSNNLDIIKNSEFERRIMPTQINSLDIEKYKAIDKEKLFALLGHIHFHRNGMYKMNSPFPIYECDNKEMNVIQYNKLCEDIIKEIKNEFSEPNQVLEMLNDTIYLPDTEEYQNELRYIQQQGFHKSSKIPRGENIGRFKIMNSYEVMSLNPRASMNSNEQLVKKISYQLRLFNEDELWRWFGKRDSRYWLILPKIKSAFGEQQ